MFNLGLPEMMIILVVALLLLGPQRLPEVARFVGRGLRELRKATQEARDAVDFEVERAELSSIQKEIEQSLNQDVYPDLVDRSWEETVPAQEEDSASASDDLSYAAVYAQPAPPEDLPAAEPFTNEQAASPHTENPAPPDTDITEEPVDIELTTTQPDRKSS